MCVALMMSLPDDVLAHLQCKPKEDDEEDESEAKGNGVKKAVFHRR